MRMMRLDLMAEAPHSSRWLAISLLMVAALTSFACLAILVGVAIVGPAGLPVFALWGSVAIFTPLSFASGWMLVRLLRNVRANNGRTMMPEWFIQGFGILLLASICVIAFTERSPLLLCETVGVAIAMIGIRRALRTSKSGSGESEPGG